MAVASAADARRTQANAGAPPTAAPEVVLEVDPTTPGTNEVALYDSRLRDWKNERSYRDGVRGYYDSLEAAGDPAAQLRLAHFLNRALNPGGR